MNLSQAICRLARITIKEPNICRNLHNYLYEMPLLSMGMRKPMGVMSISGALLCQPSCGFKTCHPSHGFKNEISNIKWNPPPQVKCIFPERSGDLKPFPEVDLTRLAPQFEKSLELQNASEELKKLCSLQFARRKKIFQTVVLDHIRRVQRHKYDMGSLEVRIAIMTAKIRYYQLHYNSLKKDTRLMQYLFVQIGRRKRMLNVLRKKDYRRFEWLLEELSIIYKPSPDFSQPMNRLVSRKGALRRLTQKYCDNIRQQRLDAYHAELKAQQAAFLKEKEETLQWIAQEEKELGIQSNEYQSSVKAGNQSDIKTQESVESSAVS